MAQFTVTELPASAKAEGLEVIHLRGEVCAQRKRPMRTFGSTPPHDAISIFIFLMF